METLLSTVLESSTYLFTKRIRSSPNDIDAARRFLASQIGKCWDQGILGLIRAKETESGVSKPRRGIFRGGKRGGFIGGGEEVGLGVREARVLGLGLSKVWKLDQELGGLAWSEIVSKTLGLLTSTSQTNTSSSLDDGNEKKAFPLAKLPSVLAALRTKLPEELEDSFVNLLGVVGRLTVGSLMQELGDWEEQEKQVESWEQVRADLKNRAELVLELMALGSLGAVLREDEVFARVCFLVLFLFIHT